MSGMNLRRGGSLATSGTRRQEAAVRDKRLSAKSVQWGVTVGGWIAWVYLVFAAALVPWTVYLAVSLPERSVSEHYRGTWVGFDVALTLVLARIAWLVRRRDPHVVLTAATGATLLVTDAWFDVTTAAAGLAHRQAVLSAVFLELPAASLCALLARRGLRTLSLRAATAHGSTTATVDPKAVHESSPSAQSGPAGRTGEP